MQTENDYDKDVYNGDLGFVARIDPDAAEVAIDFEGRELPYDVGELDEVVPAYATTVHKAQGSEYPAVVVPLVTQHWGMLRRNPVYTAVTQGQRLVVVVGQPKALAIAVRGARAAAVGEAWGAARRRAGIGPVADGGDDRVSCAVIRGDSCPTRSPPGR